MLLCRQSGAAPGFSQRLGEVGRKREGSAEPACAEGWLQRQHLLRHDLGFLPPPQLGERSCQKAMRNAKTWIAL